MLNKTLSLKTGATEFFCELVTLNAKLDFTTVAMATFFV